MSKKLHPLLSLLILCLGISTAAHAQTLDVLVTNDDGIGADGIDALVEELRTNPNLTLHLVAPAVNQSGSTDNFTTAPFTVAPGTTASGFAGTAVSGFPADSVLYGVLQLLSEPPDLVVSGINAGQNIGRFVAEDLSGTVGAALTAGRLGIPAIAVSAGLTTTDFSAPARYVANVVEDFRTKKRLPNKLASKTGLPDSLVLNVNFPFCSAGSVRGVEVVPLAHSQDLLGRVVASYQETAPDTYQAVLTSTNAFLSDCTSTLEKPTTDVEAMTNGFASVTPLNPALTPDSRWKRFKFLRKIPFE